ncbi:hypothetical protein [Streptomyces sp. NBC_00233]|uniref:hypothetical protein n=1 Tax=Streptomyces sp. NBC_00233 TaxID=2975686 RepID=UPI002255D74D|nr:hypothetical protein [Streptomyces sp. NBC_00233]MCX5229446.1 hypothetical protein [Streptomyces sp. NBC_00233]
MSTGRAAGGVRMGTGARGIAVVAAMVVALTGCGDGDGTDPVTGAAGGKEAFRPTTLDATGLVNALPVSSDFSNGTFTGGDPELVPEAEAAKFCADKLEDVDCAGVKAASVKDLVLAGSSSDEGATFTLYTFGTEAEATAVLKAVEKARKSSKGEAGTFTPVKAVTGADETFAFERDDYVGVYMRIGTVVSYVSTYRFGPEQAEGAAQVQLGRLKVVAGGGDPDA